MARLFDCGGNEALMPRACARLAARADLSFFGDIFAQQVGLLVIDFQQFVGAKLAKLGFGEKFAVTAAFASRHISIVTHSLLHND